jgi:hypothetical protein
MKNAMSRSRDRTDVPVMKNFVAANLIVREMDD